MRYHEATGGMETSKFHAAWNIAKYRRHAKV
jgi:hypothetical protein